MKTIKELETVKLIIILKKSNNCSTELKHIN